MLSYGFKDQIYNIFQFLPNDIQLANALSQNPETLGDY